MKSNEGIIVVLTFSFLCWNCFCFKHMWISQVTDDTQSSRVHNNTGNLLQHETKDDHLFMKTFFHRKRNASAGTDSSKIVFNILQKFRKTNFVSLGKEMGIFYSRFTEENVRQRIKRNIAVPGLNQECYIKDGDVMFGLLTSIRAPGEGGHLCSTELFWDAAVQETEAFVYALNTTFSRRGVLPNISLGFVILDDCNTDLVALSRSLFFLPDSNKTDSGHRQAARDHDCQKSLGAYQVTGVVGPYGSRRAALSASLLGVFHIPMISTYATSDELSDQRRYDYFLRLVAPDLSQAQAMVDFLLAMNWTYAGLLYSEGEYGENGAKSVERFAKESKVCLGLVQQLTSDVSKSQMAGIVNTILNTTVRVVALFVEDYHLYQLFPLLAEMDLQGRLVWLASDAMAYDVFGTGADGAFVIHHIDGSFPEFDDYYRSLTPANSTNPWLRDLWMSLYNCDWQAGNNSCKDVRAQPYFDHSIESYVYKTIDAVDMFTIALDKLIRERCPEAFLNKTILQACIQEPEYLNILKKSKFQGISGLIDFASGSMLGRFAVKQYIASVNDRGQTVAIWEENYGFTMMYNNMNISVYHINLTQDGYPESECSKPCERRQYKIQLELPCCWLCKPCRSNEYLEMNATGCSTCPTNTWPDAQDPYVCTPLPATRLEWHGALSIALLVLAFCGICLATIAASLLIRWREEKLIKASSRSLSSIILIGIFVAYSSVAFFIAPPDTNICCLRRVCFHLSVTLIYAPLLLKTNRVYRIFTAGKQGVQKPVFINTASQLVGVTMLLFIQVVIIIVSLNVWKGRSALRMPVPDIPYVEEFCDTQPGSLLLPLSFNLLLVLTCSVFGFLTRKLPENFNESWYIFVSITTTLFLWVVFLPTYFSVFYTTHKAALLAVSLILNATITLLCLFATRLYAVIYIADNMMHLKNVGTNVISVAPPTVSST